MRGVTCSSVFVYECWTARVVNLSRGGAFLAAETLLPIGFHIDVYLSDIPGVVEGEVLEVEGEVSWLAKYGVPDANLPKGMGICFLEMPADLRERMDSLVLGILEQRLSHLW